MAEALPDRKEDASPAMPFYFILFHFIIDFFLWLHLWHMKFPRLGVESELQLQAYTTARATLDPSCICNLCHSLQQHQTLNLVTETKHPHRHYVEFLSC